MRTVIARVDPDAMMHWNRAGTGRPWGMLVGILLLFALIALVVVLIVKMGSNRSGSAVAPSAPPGAPLASAEQLLAERLARGEIDPAEYRERLTALRGG